MEGALWEEQFGLQKKGFSKHSSFVMKPPQPLELRKAMTVILMAKLSLDPNSTAELLGTSRCTTFRDRLEVRNQDDLQKGSWGGRRRFTMTMEQEREFLAEWEAKAQSGGIL